LCVASAVAHITTVAFARGGQVDEDLVLRIQPHRLTDEVPEIDTVTLASEAQIDAVVAVPFVQDTGVDSTLGEQRHRAVLEDARTVGGPDGLVITLLDDDVVDPRLREEVGEHETCRAAADDADFGGDDRA